MPLEVSPDASRLPSLAMAKDHAASPWAGDSGFAQQGAWVESLRAQIGTQPASSSNAAGVGSRDCSSNVNFARYSQARVSVRHPGISGSPDRSLSKPALEMKHQSNRVAAGGSGEVDAGQQNQLSALPEANSQWIAPPAPDIPQSSYLRSHKDVATQTPVGTANSADAQEAGGNSLDMLNAFARNAVAVSAHISNRASDAYGSIPIAQSDLSAMDTSLALQSSNSAAELIQASHGKSAMADRGSAPGSEKNPERSISTEPGDNTGAIAKLKRVEGSLAQQSVASNQPVTASTKAEPVREPIAKANVTPNRGTHTASIAMNNAVPYERSNGTAPMAPGLALFPGEMRSTPEPPSAAVDVHTSTATAEAAFAAMDTASGRADSIWMHAMPHGAEAGFRDPALGWVSVHARTDASGLHATLVPDSSNSAQVLSTQLPGLVSHLKERFTEVESVMVGQPMDSMSNSLQSGTNEERGDGRSEQQFVPNGNTETAKNSPLRNNSTSMKPQLETIGPAGNAPQRTLYFDGAHFSAVV